MDETMKLVVGWVIIAAFTFTTAITCMSLVGWVKFVHKRQQQGLYTALILEVVLGSVSAATNLARVDPGAVQSEAEHKGEARGKTAGFNDAVSSIVRDALASGTGSFLEKDQLATLVDRIVVQPGTAEERGKSELKAKIERLPSGRIAPDAAEVLRRSEILAPIGIRAVNDTR